MALLSADFRQARMPYLSIPRAASWLGSVPKFHLPFLGPCNTLPPNFKDNGSVGLTQSCLQIRRAKPKPPWWRLIQSHTEICNDPRKINAWQYYPDYPSGKLPQISMPMKYIQLNMCMRGIFYFPQNISQSGWHSSKNSDYTRSFWDTAKAFTVVVMSWLDDLDALGVLGAKMCSTEPGLLNSYKNYKIIW